MKQQTPEQHEATNLEFGKGLGQWEDEFNGNDHIVELVVGGAKSNNYKTNKGKLVVKQKGITLDMADDEVVNFDTMRDMFLNGGTIKSKKRFRFKWDTLTKDIITQNVSRNIKSTVKEKEILMDLILHLLGGEGVISNFTPKGEVDGFLMTGFKRSEDASRHDHCGGTDLTTHTSI